MSGSIPLDRLIGQPNTLNYAANQQIVSQIDRTGLYDFLQLNVSSTLTLASYTTAPTIVGTFPAETFCNLIQSVVLTATGNAAGAATDTLVNTDLITLYEYQYFYNRAVVPSQGFTQGTSSANGAYTGSLGVKIEFSDPRSNKPGLTRLDARLLSQLQLSIGWRDQTSQVAGGVAGTAALSNTNVVVTVREWQNVAQRLRPWLRLSDRKSQTVSQQNALQFNNLPVGNVLRREFLQGIVPLVSGYNYGWSSNAAFGSTGQVQGPMWSIKTNNSVQLLSNPLSSIAQDNAQLLNIPIGALVPGWYFYEPARNAQIANSIPLWGINTASDYIDVAAPGSFGSYVKFTDVEIIGATLVDLGM